MSIKITDEVKDTLLALEQKLLTPGLRRNAQAAGDLLDDDFLEIGQSGRTFTKKQILEFMEAEKDDDQLWSIENFSVRQLAPTIALATYRIRENRSLRSSVWRRSDNKWKIVFHQGTPSPEESAT
ncbi:MAG: DUF4440 domain-containing protein [Pseudomonadota bacterium]